LQLDSTPLVMIGVRDVQIYAGEPMGRVGTSRVFPGPAFAFGAGTSAVTSPYVLVHPDEER